MTAAGAKFSEAIISRVDCWRLQFTGHGLLHLGIDYGKSLVQLLNHGCSFEIPLLSMTDISV